MARDLGSALGVSAACAAALEALVVRKTIPPRSYLCFEGDDSTHVYFVETGLLRIDRVMPSGRNVLFELATPGDVVGELGVIDNVARSASISTIEASQLAMIRAQDFSDLLASSTELSNVLLARVAQRLRALSDQLVEATAYTAAGRVAARLVRLMDLDDNGRRSAPFELRLPITQEELGQWSGLSREGVVKGLSQLRASGVIETGRRRITVHDIAALRAAGQTD